MPRHKRLDSVLNVTTRSTGESDDRKAVGACRQPQRGVVRRHDEIGAQHLPPKHGGGEMRIQGFQSSASDPSGPAGQYAERQPERFDVDCTNDERALDAPRRGALADRYEPSIPVGVRSVLVSRVAPRAMRIVEGLQVRLRSSGTN